MNFDAARWRVMNGIGYARFFGDLVSGARIAHERALAQWRARDLAPFFDPRQSWRILDLANGRLRPQYALLGAAGQRVVGVDRANGSLRFWEDVAYRFARALYGARINRARAQHTAAGLVCGDVGALPFRAETFDLVTSIAAFEHFLDVPTVVTELARVTRVGGIVWVCIHLFTAPSGGHNLGFVQVPLRRVPWGVEPWDHLRQRRLPFTVPLNEWRVQQYRAEFARHFEIVNAYCAMREGEQLLTAELARELSAYARAELTCGAYVFVLRKPIL